MDFTKALLFDQQSGQFTFGSTTQPSTGAFRISLGDPGIIIVNIDAGSGIEFTPDMPDSRPIKPLTSNNSGSFEILSADATQIKLKVSTLPSTSGVLGFMLFVQLTTGSPIVKAIETPAFFITRDEPCTALNLTLKYLPSTGDFQIMEDGGPPLPILLPVEKGVVLLRLSEGGSNDDAVRTITVDLHQDTIAAGVIFAEIAAKATLPIGSAGLSISRGATPTTATITKTFTPGTGFGVSFAMKIPLEDGGTCTVYSPDPVIIDKQIGGSGG